MNRELSISVAIPIFNEESIVDELYRRLRDVLRQLSSNTEIVFVDDGSTDGSAELLDAICEIDPQAKVIRLSRNFGHQTALTCALDHVGGDVVILMDGDLQDRPETIPAFVEKYRQGYDVVYAVREKRKEGWIKRTCYRLFYKLISVLANIDLPVDAGDFGLLSRRVVQQMRNSPERIRYLRGIRTWVGFRQTGIAVERDRRHSGEPKYTLGKLLQLACDGIFSFSIMPLRLATWIGLGAAGCTLAFGMYCLVAKLLFDQSPHGFTALILAITFLAGVQLVFLGIIGEYVGRIYLEVKQRPHYVIDRIKGVPLPPSKRSLREPSVPSTVSATPFSESSAMQTY